MAGYSRPAVASIFGVPALGGLLFGWDIGATSYVLTQLQSAEYAGVSWSGAVAPMSQPNRRPPRAGTPKMRATAGRE